MLRHYLGYGLRGGQSPTPLMDLGWYAEQYEDVPKDPYGALRHFIILGDIEGRAPGPLFDGQLYRARYPDVAEIGMPAALSFPVARQIGGPAGRVRPPAGAGGREVTRSMEVGLPLPVDADAVQRDYDAMRDRLDLARRRRQETLVVPKPPMHVAKPLPKRNSPGWNSRWPPRRVSPS